jgi:hypothetical protein
MKLMGVDVGFAKKRKTTGIACLNENELHVVGVGEGWFE